MFVTMQAIKLLTGPAADMFGHHSGGKVLSRTRCWRWVSSCRRASETNCCQSCPRPGPALPANAYLHWKAGHSLAAGASTGATMHALCMSLRQLPRPAAHSVELKGTLRSPAALCARVLIRVPLDARTWVAASPAAPRPCAAAPLKPCAAAPPVHGAYCRRPSPESQTEGQHPAAALRPGLHAADKRTGPVMQLSYTGLSTTSV